MEVNGMSVVRAVVKCALAVTECMGIICRCAATLLEGSARMLRQYSEEPVVIEQQETERQPDLGTQLGLVKQELNVNRWDAYGDESVVGSEYEPPSMERLTAPGHFYAVARGTKCGLFQSWFTAGQQVLNVPGSMQERFGS